MMKRHFYYVIPLAATLIVPAIFAQQTDNQSSQPTAAQTQSADNTNSQYATGAPLQGQSKEGFWGHLNPFARKKYIQRQMDPIRGRVNELDELTAKNANSIKDVDSRAQEGIRQANSRAGEADQHAMAANQLATQANQTALDASNRLQGVQKTVSSLDQYQPVTDAEIRFKPGQTKLGTQAQQALDQIADQLKGHSGYILQVQGFSTTKGQSGIANSQAITQSVVRYLVEQHDVPLYRIYTVGLGNAVMKSAAAQGTEQASAAPAKKFRGGRVEVALLKNSLADMNGQSAVGATQSATPDAQNGTSTQTPR